MKAEGDVPGGENGVGETDRDRPTSPRGTVDTEPLPARAVNDVEWLAQLIERARAAAYQRGLATQGIHAMGCLGWKPVDGADGAMYHVCRSVAGNVVATLHTYGQLVPDDFSKPRDRARTTTPNGTTDEC